MCAGMTIVGHFAFNLYTSGGEETRRTGPASVNESLVSSWNRFSLQMGILHTLTVSPIDRTNEPGKVI